MSNFLLLVMLNSSFITCQIELLQIHQKELNEEQSTAANTSVEDDCGSHPALDLAVRRETGGAGYDGSAEERRNPEGVEVRVQSNPDFYMYAIKKVCNYIQAIKKIDRTRVSSF